MKSHTIKIISLWSLFAFALFGVFALSHDLTSKTWNAAAVFLSSGVSHEISLYKDSVSPTEITANVGEEILFVVKDDSFHDIAEERTQKQFPRLESGEIQGGESYSLVFQDKGTYSFYDRMHQDLHVTITIE